MSPDPPLSSGRALVSRRGQRHRPPGPGSCALSWPEAARRGPAGGGGGGFSGRALPRVCESRSSSINSSPWMTLWTPWPWLTGLVISCSFSLCIWAYTVLPGRFLRGRGGAQGAVPPGPLGPRPLLGMVQTTLLDLFSCPFSAADHLLQEALPPVSSHSPGFPWAPVHECALSGSPGDWTEVVLQGGGVLLSLVPRHPVCGRAASWALTGWVGHAFPWHTGCPPGSERGLLSPVQVLGLCGPDFLSLQGQRERRLRAQPPCLCWDWARGPQARLLRVRCLVSLRPRKSPRSPRRSRLPPTLLARPGQSCRSAGRRPLRATEGDTLPPAGTLTG